MSANLRDRLFSDTGGVIQGATVQAILVTGGGTDTGTSSTVQATTTTDVNGVWKFTALPDPGAGNWYDVKIINGNQVIWRYGNIQAAVSSLLLQATVWASPHFTSPVVDSGGLTVTAGGLTVTAGGLTVTGGATLASGLLTLPISSSGPNESVRLVTDNGAGFSRIMTNTVGANPGACLVRFDVANGTTSQSQPALALYGSGDVAAGVGSISNGATGGFLYIPSGGGSPTGVPTGQGGFVPIRFDSSTNKLWVYTGGAWKGVAVA